MLNLLNVIFALTKVYQPIKITNKLSVISNVYTRFPDYLKKMISDKNSSYPAFYFNGILQI